MTSSVEIVLFPKRALVVLVCGFLSAAALAHPVIDDSPTRVQTSLRVPLRQVGTLRPKSVAGVEASRWTLDCGGMDRESADWRAVREYVAPLGIARIRLQAGWTRCEKGSGAYDFAWLDQIVFDAAKMGVKVWMELGGGGRGIPTAPERLAAWDRWVERMARRYNGVIDDWCVWSEPGNVPAAAADFAIRTAEIVKREIPDASVTAVALSRADVAFVEPFAKALAARGKAALFTSVAYRHDTANPDDGYEEAERCRALLAQYAPNLKLWEVEGGARSEWDGTGALGRLPWSELVQAKYVLRRTLGDLGHGDDTDVFHICDLDCRAGGSQDELVRCGLVKTTGQADGFRVLKVKTAYYAVQNAVSVFNDSLRCLDRRTTSTVSGLSRGYVCDWKAVRDGTPVVVFWDASGMPSDRNEARTVEVRVKGVPLPDPVWTDVLTGDVYAIPQDSIRGRGDWTAYVVPAYDSPVFITSARLLDTVESRYERSGQK